MSNDDLPRHAPSTGSKGEGELSVDEALALDLALGILDEPSRGGAIARCAQDPDFDRLVTRYRQMIDHNDDPDFLDRRDGIGIAPSSKSWAAIQARIGEDRES